MGLVKGLRRVSERKMESGPFSIEIEDRPLIADRDCKLMDTSPFTYSRSAINFFISTISEVLMPWMSLKRPD
jgi:hypothetical protein